tara:strand:+ start:193 stop:312 length:120 start_codon:yes stop_codon:yes gene_type:complete
MICNQINETGAKENAINNALVAMLGWSGHMQAPLKELIH